MVGWDATHTLSALRWEWIIAVAVFVADATIWPMDDQLGLMFSCDLPARIDGLLLCIMHGGCPLVASTFDSPPAIVGNYMLIFT